MNSPASPESPRPVPGRTLAWQLAFWTCAALGLAGFALAYLYTTGLWEFLVKHTEPAKHYGLQPDAIIGYLRPQFWRTSGCLLGLLLWLAVLCILGARAWPGAEVDRPRRFIQIAVAAALAGLGVGFWLSWGFELDDKWITYRTSLNILRTGLPVWNLGEKVNLSTSFIWPYLCVVGHLFGDWNSTVKVIGFLFVALNGWLAWRLIPHRVYALVGAFGVGLFYPLVLWSFGGLETSLAACYLSFAVLWFLARGGRSLLALALMGGTMFVRPDLVLVGSGVLAILLLARESLAFKAKAVLAYAAPIGGFLAFHRLVFGVPFPRPFYMKGLHKTSSISYGWINEVFTGTIHLNAALTLFLLVLAVFVAVLFAHARARRMPALVHWGVAFGLLLHVGYTHLCGYQHMAFTFRYYVPTIIAAFLLLLFALADLRRSVPAARFEPRFLLAALAVQAGVFTFTARQGQQCTLAMTRCILRDNFSLNSYAGWMKAWIESGRYLSRIAKPEETLFTWANMVAPSVSEVYTIDQFYMPYALSSRPEIAAFAQPGSNHFEKFTYVLTGPDRPEVLAAQYPNHYVLKQYPNLVILRQKPAPTTPPASSP
ncbi:MAG TPA: hypothetical protein VHD61_08950 [Lacunisphaera sp.]|nr:hypothetical protein [Lacunisphaera sp.]